MQIPAGLRTGSRYIPLCLAIALSLTGIAYLTVNVQNVLQDARPEMHYRLAFWLPFVIFLLLLLCSVGFGSYRAISSGQGNAQRQANQGFVLAPVGQGGGNGQANQAAAQDQKFRWSSQVGAILTLASFILVWLYYDRVASPQRPLWQYQVEVDHRDSLPQPAIVVATGDFSGQDGGCPDAPGADAAFAHFRQVPDGPLTKCYFPTYGVTCLPPSPQDVQKFNSSIYGNIQYLQYTPDSTSREFDTLSQRKNFQVFSGWDSKAIEGCYGPASAPQLPYYYYAIFDRRLNFAKSLECGLIALREMPAFGSNSLLLTASYYDDSVLKVLPRNHTDPDCDRLPRSYYQFDVTMSSTSAYNPTSCDANTTDTCTSQMLIRYSTFNVPSYTTVQGISAVQILTDEGGILGGAAFLFWYFGIWDLFV